MEFGTMTVCLQLYEHDRTKTKRDRRMEFGTMTVCLQLYEHDRIKVKRDRRMEFCTLPSLLAEDILRYLHDVPTIFQMPQNIVKAVTACP
ncbi:hypothetical protein AVEN_44816-1 [Araneus ventricosus]|uniref:Uncharacterized protein n=1 Tax=Araneus ventricosus TaxID=182803 RepID=A0A4Y2PJ45_ARAVE|nr:hypothetical protein AVEN_44816-1 [Araneus ventricosus]